jgi:hypothetical protein
MFKVGEIVVCINILPVSSNGRSSLEYTVDNKIYSSQNLGLTFEKKYEIIKINNYDFLNGTDYFVHIVNDRNETQDYRISRFISLLEYRKQKIKKIKLNV